MLTAICMLYFGGGVLPGQRAELYDKFIICMLKRRFPETEKIYRFLMLLALDMHNHRELGAGQQDALKILGTIYAPETGESEAMYSLRLEQEFERIEQNYLRQRNPTS